MATMVSPSGGRRGPRRCAGSRRGEGNRRRCGPPGNPAAGTRPPAAPPRPARPRRHDPGQQQDHAASRVAVELQPALAGQHEEGGIAGTGARSSVTSTSPNHIRKSGRRASAGLFSARGPASQGTGPERLDGLIPGIPARRFSGLTRHAAGDGPALRSSSAGRHRRGCAHLDLHALTRACKRQTVLATVGGPEKSEVMRPVVC